MAADRGARAIAPKPARALRIGLTGPIGCGKSTVGRWLAESGATLIDADQVARSVTAPGTPAHDAILASFGDGVRAADGSVDRAALGRIVFADPARLRELEAIVHPAVRPAILERLATAEASGAAIVALEAIRLVEGGLAEMCDEVWLIDCDPAEQRARLEGRGSEAGDAERRMAAQAGLRERLHPLATLVLDTTGDPDTVRERVLVAAAAARKRAGSGAS